MTQKDYILIASALKRTKPDPTEGAAKRVQWNRDVKVIAGVLAMDNAKFNRHKFDTASDFLS